MGTNRYAYGMNNPIMLKDPSGNRVSDVGPLGRLGGSEANSASNSLHDNGMSVPGDAVSDLVANTGFGRPFDEEDEYDVAAGKDIGSILRAGAKRFPRAIGPIDKNLRYADKQITRFMNRNINNPLRELAKRLMGPKVPGRVQSRINVRVGNGDKNTGLLYALKKHGGAGSINKSQFSISVEQLKALLQSKKVVSSPVRISPTSGQFMRVVNTGSRVGNYPVKSGGAPTSHITVITDKFGNLINTFPGKPTF